MAVDLLSIAKSGLFASKKSLETTGHNIANVNSDGFTRQTVHQSSAPPINSGGLIMGSGVRVTGINRIHDEYVEKRLRDQNSESNFFKSRADKLSQVENIFNEIDSEGLNKVLNKFFNSFRDLANQPENETIRSIVRENAKLVVKDFRRIKESLRDISRQIGSEVQRSADEINFLLTSVADYNKKIASIEAVGGESGDLRDKRDVSVKDLSKYFKLHTYADEANQFVIQAEGIGSLVSGSSVQYLKANPSPKDLTSSGLEGDMELYLANKPTYPISSNVSGGTFLGLFKTRNSEVLKLMNQMDELAYNVTQSVNAVHRKGFISAPLETDQNGNAITSRKITGINFFQELNSVSGAADQLDLSNDLKNDLNNLTTALAINRPGDNRVSIAISKLQHEKMLGDMTKTLEEHFLDSVGQIALASAKANLDKEQSEGVMAQITSIKERISGVSIDEEAANLVKFQQAYDASAKVMATSEEMFRTVLGIMPAR